MERIKIAALYADAARLDGQTVAVCGWARTIRDMKTFGFIELNDGSCFRNLQVVMDANTLDNYKDVAAQNVGAALIVTGTLVLTPEAKQPLEVKAAAIEVEGVSSPDYPLQKKRHSVEYLRTIAHLRPRTNLFSAAFRVRSAAAHAVHCFFQDRGFVYVHTPIITDSIMRTPAKMPPGELALSGGHRQEWAYCPLLWRSSHLQMQLAAAPARPAPRIRVTCPRAYPLSVFQQIPQRQETR